MIQNKLNVNSFSDKVEIYFQHYHTGITYTFPLRIYSAYVKRLTAHNTKHTPCNAHLWVLDPSTIHLAPSARKMCAAQMTAPRNLRTTKSIYVYTPRKREDGQIYSI